MAIGVLSRTVKHLPSYFAAALGIADGGLREELILKMSKSLVSILLNQNEKK